MSATISISQNKLINELLAAGRWRNKSEVIRHGLELVKREVESENLKPFTPEELAASRSQLSSQEIEEETRMASASAYPSAKDLEP